MVEQDVIVTAFKTWRLERCYNHLLQGALLVFVQLLKSADLRSQPRGEHHCQSVGEKESGAVHFDLVDCGYLNISTGGIQRTVSLDNGNSSSAPYSNRQQDLLLYILWSSISTRYAFALLTASCNARLDCQPNGVGETPHDLSVRGVPQMSNNCHKLPV